MKKNYQKPSIAIVELVNSCVLLAGSDLGPEKPPKSYEQIHSQMKIVILHSIVF